MSNPAREKVESEGRCRVCKLEGEHHLDAAHTWNRSQKKQGFDDPDSIVPLCSRYKGGAGCHDAYDANRLDLLAYLTTDEQVALVRNAGSIERARNRAIGKGQKGKRRVAHDPEPDIFGPF